MSCAMCGEDARGRSVCQPCIQAELLFRGKLKPTTVYLSGGITGIEGYRVNFEKARNELHRLGLDVLDPSTFAPEGSGNWTWDQWMEYDLDILKRIAASVYMLNGWKDSKGAVIEYETALATGKKVFIQEWNDGQDILDEISNDIISAAERV